jgi:hypothetical protein
LGGRGEDDDIYGRHGVEEEMTTSVFAAGVRAADAAADEAIISFHMEEHLFLIRNERGILTGKWL